MKIGDKKNPDLNNEQVQYEFYSKSLCKKFNVNYDDKLITFDDGVTYSFKEISNMKQNISTFDVHLGHLLKDIFKVTYVGPIQLEEENE